MKALWFMPLFLVACGGGGGYQDPPPSTQPTSPEKCQAEWAALAPVVQHDCAGCHDGRHHGTLLPRAEFDRHPNHVQIQSGLMPPQGAVLSVSDRAAFDAYFTCTGT